MRKVFHARKDGITVNQRYGAPPIIAISVFTIVSLFTCIAISQPAEAGWFRPTIGERSPLITNYEPKGCLAVDPDNRKSYLPPDLAIKKAESAGISILTNTFRCGKLTDAIKAERYRDAGLYHVSTPYTDDVYVCRWPYVAEGPTVGLDGKIKHDLCFMLDFDPP